MSYRPLAGLCLFLATVTIAACTSEGGTNSSESAVVSGTVTYRPRIALPPDAMVRVWLEDVTTADAPATIVEDTVRTDGRQVPIPFVLNIAPGSIDPSHSYAVRAEIHGENTLLWVTDSAYGIPPPGTQSAAVDIVVMQAQMPPSDMGAAADSLVGSSWRLVRIEVGDSTVTPAAQEKYTIAFDSAGRYSGQAHCNRYGGEFQAAPDGMLELRQGLTTLAACAPPSSSDSFMNVLDAIGEYSIMNGELRLTTGTGDALVFRSSAGQ